MSEPELKCVLQLADEALAQKSVEAMREMGIAAKYVHQSKIPKDEIPEWIDAKKPGWILYIEASRFEEGMSKLGEIMGYTPD